MEKEYVAEYLVHEGSCVAKNLVRPSVVIKLMQFPAVVIEGNLTGKLVFSKGKSCRFTMSPGELLRSIGKDPVFMMLVDSYCSSVKLIGSASVSISMFSNLERLFKPEFQRGFIDLYDPVKNVVAKLDMSIAIYEYSAKPYTTSPLVFSDSRNTEKSTGTEPTLNAKKQAANTQIPGQRPSPSFFGDSSQPPPLYFTSGTKDPSLLKYRAPPDRQCTVQPPVPSESPSPLIHQLFSEVELLKKASALNSQWAYPPTISFTKAKPQFTLETRQIPGISIKPSPSEYSDDFEEESIEKVIKCFVCGEMVRVREAANHRNCQRHRRAQFLSPREEHETSQSYRDTKSITTSIIEEYSNDFEEESDY